MGQAKVKEANREDRVAARFAMHSVKPLTCLRYNAFVAWTRMPIAGAIGEEVEFFSMRNERAIGR